jgi:hypothetical protein
VSLLELEFVAMDWSALGASYLFQILQPRKPGALVEKILHR